MSSFPSGYTSIVVPFTSTPSIERNTSFSSLTFIAFKFLQPINGTHPILSKPPGNVISEGNSSQYANAAAPIDFKFFPNSTSFKLVHHLNA